MELGRGTGSSVQGVKKGIYNETSASSTWLGQGDKSKSKSIRVCNRRSIVDKVWG